MAKDGRTCENGWEVGTVGTYVYDTKFGAVASSYPSIVVFAFPLVNNVYNVLGIMRNHTYHTLSYDIYDISDDLNVIM